MFFLLLLVTLIIAALTSYIVVKFFDKLDSFIGEPVGGVRLFVADDFVRQNFGIPLGFFDDLLPVSTVEHELAIGKAH